MATLDPVSRRLVLWAADGGLNAAFVLPTTTSVRSAALAVRGDLVLECAEDQDHGLLSCIVLDMRSQKVRGHFRPSKQPYKIFAAPGGWLLESATGAEKPRLSFFADDGKELKAPPFPDGIWMRASRENGHGSAAVSRIFATGQELWGVPGGFYEFWRFAGGTQARVPVPACLHIAGNVLEGEPAVRKLLERFADADDETRRRIEAFVERSRTDTAPMHGFAAAVIQVATCGSHAAVLLEPFPERQQGGCRLDVWEFPGPSVIASLPVAGPCPSSVALAPRGAWLKQGRRFVWMPLDLEAVRPSEVCGSATGVGRDLAGGRRWRPEPY